MDSFRRVYMSLPVLYRRATVGKDGVYREAECSVIIFALAFVEPGTRACMCILLYALLVGFLLCVYVGASESVWQLFVHSASVLRLSLSPLLERLYLLSPQYVNILPEKVAPHGHPRGEDGLQLQINPTEIHHTSLRLLFRHALCTSPWTSALGCGTFLPGLVEVTIFLLLLLFAFRHVRHVAAGYRRASLNAYCKRLVSAAEVSCQMSSLPSFASAGTRTPQLKSIHQETTAKKGEQLKIPAAASTRNLLKGQVVVITGVTSGIGTETALQLAKWGARVYFGARNVEQGRLIAAAINAEVDAAETAPSAHGTSFSLLNEIVKRMFSLRLLCDIYNILTGALYSRNTRIQNDVSTSIRTCTDGRSKSTPVLDSYRPGAYVHELDLCRAASICEFSRWVLAETNDQVDILINNAGQMCVPKLTPVKFTDAASFEYHIACNHMGHFLLTRLLLPALKRSAASAEAASVMGNKASSVAATVGGARSGAGRIINVSSCAHLIHTSGFGVLNAACTYETAAAGAAAIASDKVGSEHGGLASPQQQLKEEERRVAESRLQAWRQPNAKTYHSWRAYADSKLCNIWFTKELQRQLLLACSATTTSHLDINSSERRSHKVSEVTSNHNGQTKPQEQATCNIPCVGVYAVHPGGVATDIWRHFTRNIFSKLIVALANKVILKTPADGAATTLFLCVAPKQVLHYGGFYADGCPSWVSPAAHDKKAQRELWVVSEDVFRPFLAAAPAAAHMAAMAAAM